MKSEKAKVEAWKTLARRRVIDFGKWLTVESHTVQLHDGRVIENWPYIVTPDYINVVIETVEGKFVFFRQTKYTIDGTSLAPVGGYLEPGEDPLIAAKREVLEELGYVAREWIPLGTYLVDPNRGPMVGNLFLARGARWVQERNADDLEEQEVLLLTRAEAESALERGEFKVLAWQAAVALGLLHLDKLSLRDSQSHAPEADCASALLFQEEKMPEIKPFPKMRVAYVTATGPYGDVIQAAFGKLFGWLSANQVQPLGAPIGIFYDDPAKVAPANLRSELCVPVAPNVQGSGEVGVKEIGGFQTATIVCQGTQNVQRSYDEVYAWLHAQGYADAGAPMETYLSQPPDELRAEVAVPIVKVVAPAPKKVAAKKPAKKVVKKAKKPVKKSKRK